MLFFISEEVAQQAANGDDEIIDSLYSLGYFWRTGCCLVDGSRSSLQKLADIDKLKDDYELILQQKQSVLGLYKEIDFFVVLSADDNPAAGRIIDGAEGKAVSINHFKNRIKYGLSLVLCENIRDYDFYKWGAQYFSDIDDDVFKIQSLGYNGGGAVIVESAKHIADLPCLAICDNDKKYPEDDEGQTLTDFRNYYLSERPLLTWMYEIKVHEIENLIPHNLLCMAYSTKGLVNKMKGVKTNPHYGLFFSFFDFKEGFKRCTLRKMRNENVASYNSYLSFLRSIGVPQSKIDSTLASSFKKNESSLLSGLSGELLRYVVEFVCSHNLTTPVVLDDHQKDDWRNITRKMWSIGCANNPRRV